MLLEYRTKFQKALVLCFGTKAEDVFNASPVVPTAVEDNDFTGRWEMRDVSL